MSSQLAALVVNKMEEQQWDTDLDSIHFLILKKKVYLIRNSFWCLKTIRSDIGPHLDKFEQAIAEDTKMISLYLYSAAAAKIQFNYNFMAAFLSLEF